MITKTLFLSSETFLVTREIKTAITLVFSLSKNVQFEGLRCSIIDNKKTEILSIIHKEKNTIRS